MFDDLGLEYVRGPRTCDVDIATARVPEKRFKKVTCLVGNCNGFIGSRIMGVSGSSDLMNEGSHRPSMRPQRNGHKGGPLPHEQLGRPRLAQLALRGRGLASLRHAEICVDACMLMTSRSKRFAGTETWHHCGTLKFSIDANMLAISLARVPIVAVAAHLPSSLQRVRKL